MGTPLELEKSEMALADAKEELAKATLSLRQAELDLEHVKMTAPLDGIVLERLVNPGENTSPRPDRDETRLAQQRSLRRQDQRRKDALGAIGPAGRSQFPGFPG